MANLFQHAIDHHFYKCWSSLALPILLCCVNALHRADKRHSSSNYKQELQGYQQPCPSQNIEPPTLPWRGQARYNSCWNFSAPWNKDKFSSKGKFKSKANYSPFIQIQSSTWHLLQDALNRSLSSLDNLPLRREDPFLLKINREAFHFKFQPENLYLTPKFLSIFFLNF